MKNLILKYLIAWVMLVLVVSCTEVKYDNPLDPQGTNYHTVEITLKGDSVTTITLGDLYTDAGATAVEIATQVDYTSKIEVSGSVNSAIAGDYTITYTISDGLPVPVKKTRLIKVLNPVDTTAPVITLTGDSVITISAGQAYVEPSYIAIDNIDGDIRSKVVITGAVKTTPGTYHIVYSVSDAAGNKAIKTLTVIVEPGVVADVTSPLITLKGDSLMNIALNTPFIDPGVLAIDNIDGDITSKVSKSGSVDVTKAGIYTISYVSTDVAGNSADTKRIVTVYDANTQILTLKLKGSSPVIVPVNTVYVDSGATATDTKDGDITKNIKVTSNVDTKTVGSYTVTYSITNSANTVVTKSRSVKVNNGSGQDLTPPVITLKGDSVLTLKVGTAYVESGATALDNVDGDVTKNIIVNSSTVNTASAGTYTVTYTVVDAASNVGTKTRLVKVTSGPVADVTPPVITLLGDSVVTSILGNSYKDAGATATDNIDGPLSNKIVTTGTVDTSKLGAYTITYTVKDIAGNTGTKTRTVNVKESGGDLAVKYNVPSASPLPTTNKSYTTAQVDGAGPDLTAVSQFTFNWDLTNKSIYGFAFSFTPYLIDATQQKIYFEDITSKVTNTFSQTQPQFTIKGASIPKLDGSYYITVSGTSLIWVRTDNSFAIVFK